MIISPGKIINNKISDEIFDNQSTIIVMGYPREGTKFITELLIENGVYMGDVNPAAYQDKKFNYEFQKKDLNQDDFDLSLINTIKERNQQFNMWGWCYPKSYIYLKKIIPYLRDPKIICIYGDAYSIVSSGIQNNKDPISLIDQALKLQINTLEYLKGYGSPLFLCSYDLIQKSYLEFIKLFNEFIGM